MELFLYGYLAGILTIVLVGFLVATYSILAGKGKAGYSAPIDYIPLGFKEEPDRPLLPLNRQPSTKRMAQIIKKKKDPIDEIVNG